MSEPFVSTTRLPELTQQLAAGSPMSPIYISPEDSLRVTISNVHPTTPYAFSGRLLRTDGVTVPLLQELRKTVDGTAAVTVIELAEGYLLSGAIFPHSGEAVRGDCWGSLGLIRGSTPGAPPFAILGTGYVSSLQPLTWPWGVRNETVLDGPGKVDVIVGTPVTGAAFMGLVPPNRAWLVKSVAFTLTTDATVGDRIAQVWFVSLTHVVMVVQAVGTQAASLANSYTCGLNVNAQSTTGQVHHVLALPTNVLLQPGWRVDITAGGLKPGDIIGDILVMVESFQYWNAVP